MVGRFLGGEAGLVSHIIGVVQQVAVPGVAEVVVGERAVSATESGVDQADLGVDGERGTEVADDALDGAGLETGADCGLQGTQVTRPVPAASASMSTNILRAAGVAAGRRTAAGSSRRSGGPRRSLVI
ncbi:hypothetical protein [Streptacidiphilus sp. PAMC 29251]